MASRRAILACTLRSPVGHSTDGSARVNRKTRRSSKTAQYRCDDGWPSSSASARNDYYKVPSRSSTPSGQKAKRSRRLRTRSGLEMPRTAAGRRRRNSNQLGGSRVPCSIDSSAARVHTSSVPLDETLDAPVRTRIRAAEVENRPLTTAMPNLYRSPLVTGVPLGLTAQSVFAVIRSAKGIRDEAGCATGLCKLFGQARLGDFPTRNWRPTRLQGSPGYNSMDERRKKSPFGDLLHSLAKGGS